MNSNIKAIADVTSAREKLADAQIEARRVFVKTINEKKKVVFKPSDFWKKKIEQGDFDLSQALDDEGVDTIEFTQEDMVPRTGRIMAIEVKDDGMIAIKVQAIDNSEELEIKEGDTLDADRLLEFVERFS